MKTRYTDRSILHLIFQVASSESAISFLSFFLTSQSAERLWIRETRSNAGTKNNAVRILPSSHGQSEWQRVTDRSTKPWNSYPLSWKQAYWREPLTPLHTTLTRTCAVECICKYLLNFVCVSIGDSDMTQRTGWESTCKDRNSNVLTMNSTFL